MFILFCCMFLNKGNLLLLYSWMRSHKTNLVVDHVTQTPCCCKSFKILITKYQNDHWFKLLLFKSNIFPLTICLPKKLNMTNTQLIEIEKRKETDRLKKRVVEDITENGRKTYSWNSFVNESLHHMSIITATQLLWIPDLYNHCFNSYIR